MAVVILTVDPRVLDWPTTVVADGNAATQGLDRGQSRVEIIVGREGVVAQRKYYPASFVPRRRDVTHFYDEAQLPSRRTMPKRHRAPGSHATGPDTLRR